MPFDGTPVTSPIIERLRLGRARIESGWCRHAAFRQTRDGPKYCAVGALNNDASAIWYLSRALPRRRTSIVHFNDKDATLHDIVALYDRAIDLAIADHLRGAAASVIAAFDPAIAAA